MSIMPLLWIVWACMTLILITLVIYRTHLTRYEEDQIFLDDSFDGEQKEQSEILVRVKRVEPAVKVLAVTTSLMTVAIVGMYLWDAIRQFNM
jgi:hypothetical protein